MARLRSNILQKKIRNR